MQTAEEQYRRAADPLVLRTHDAIQRFFDGSTLVEPGLVHFSRWRSDGTDDGALPPEMSGVYGASAACRPARLVRNPKGLRPHYVPPARLVLRDLNPRIMSRFVPFGLDR
ncbi:hypothetical protein HCN51_54860 [Nonomuraea sp. FMUSA5-5]|uniref:Uncharacterized protein n=1 Tax=Nonomuraea composti TaxID=2720023 RepID=A0ABX1BP92_9ACTN|nr:hypothetical protein [Nonomuraea sp. FMUSA5-5]